MPDVVRITDESGAVVATREYDAFGNVLAETGDWNHVRFGFHPNWTQLKDSGGRLYLTPGGRVYDTHTGRFLQRDPIHVPGQNAYVALDNNPVNVADPTGLQSVRPLTPREKQHVQNALRELSASSFPESRAFAPELAARLAAGQIKVDSGLDSGAETAGTELRLSKGKADPDFGLRPASRKPLDPKGTHRAATLSTASTLVHEQVHARQGAARRAASALAYKCFGSHAAEIQAYQTQLRVLRGMQHKERDPKVLAELKALIGEAIRMLRKYGGTPGLGTSPSGPLGAHR